MDNVVCRGLLFASRWSNDLPTSRLLESNEDKTCCSVVPKICVHNSCVSSTIGIGQLQNTISLITFYTPSGAFSLYKINITYHDYFGSVCFGR